MVALFLCRNNRLGSKIWRSAVRNVSTNLKDKTIGVIGMGHVGKNSCQDSQLLLER
jgi:phosphoglycerate dehydrogenase-like enzyme